eukprot:1506408-Amphidinium_carterae.1
MTPKLQTGFYLGHHARTGALMVLTPNGVKQAAGFGRVSPSERWAGPLLMGTPWDPFGTKDAPQASKWTEPGVPVPYVPVQ